MADMFVLMAMAGGSVTAWLASVPSLDVFLDQGGKTVKVYFRVFILVLMPFVVVKYVSI